jgi:hypothetical protein
VLGPNCDVEGPGSMLHCDGSISGCRVCDKCRFSEDPVLCSGGRAKHSDLDALDGCQSRQAARKACLLVGHEVILLPDFGVGRKVFEGVLSQK